MTATATKPKTMVLEMEVFEEENGSFFGIIPSWRGCITNGNTREELRDRMTEAAILYWDCIKDGEVLVRPAPILEFVVIDRDRIEIEV